MIKSVNQEIHITLQKTFYLLNSNYNKKGENTLGNNHCLERISVNPKIMNGKAVIKGTRIPFFIILEFLESENSIDDVLEIYPSLQRKDKISCTVFH